MTEPKTHRHIVRNRKKSHVPLAKLRTSDAVKTVVDHPRRLQELIRMLDDKDRGVRGRAAATLARLSESHSTRLIKLTARLKEAASDDSAYVRWNIAYALGSLGFQYPARSFEFSGELLARLEDENRVVRVMASKALAQVAAKKPSMIEELFQTSKKEIPAAVGRSLCNAKKNATK
jgi:oligoendopeptidase F